MAKKHKVEPGDWLGVIAKKYAFSDWRSIWEHPANHALRELRRSPDLLLVGDEVVIPNVATPPGLPVATGHRATFVIGTADSLRLRVTGLEVYLSVFGPIDFRLEVGPHALEGVLEEDGQELVIPLEKGVNKGSLSLQGSKPHEFFIGGLGPASEGVGARARLLNLGYRSDIPPGGEGSEDADADPLSWLLAWFQRRNDLPSTGELDEGTRKTLEEQYGV